MYIEVKHACWVRFCIYIVVQTRVFGTRYIIRILLRNLSASCWSRFGHNFLDIGHKHVNLGTVYYWWCIVHISVLFIMVINWFSDKKNCMIYTTNYCTWGLYVNTSLTICMPPLYDCINWAGTCFYCQPCIRRSTFCISLETFADAYIFLEVLFNNIFGIKWME